MEKEIELKFVASTKNMHRYELKNQDFIATIYISKLQMKSTPSSITVTINTVPEHIENNS